MNREELLKKIDGLEKFNDFTDILKDQVKYVNTGVERHYICLEDLLSLLNETPKSKPVHSELRVMQYNKETNRLQNYISESRTTPCHCDSMFHYEYDVFYNKMYGVCNICNQDIFVVKDKYVPQLLHTGIWR